MDFTDAVEICRPVKALDGNQHPVTSLPAREHLYGLIEKYVGNPAAQLEIKLAVVKAVLAAEADSGRFVLNTWARAELVKSCDVDALDCTAERR